MSKQKRSPSNETYEAIVSDALEDVDGEGQCERKKIPHIREMLLFRSGRGKILVTLLAVNIIWFALQLGVSSAHLSEEEADKELKEKYGEDYAAFEAIDNLITPEVTSPQRLQTKLHHLNDILSEDGEETEATFQKEHFYFFGDTVVYTEPVH